MNKQTGISTAGIALVVVVLAAAGGGFYGWQELGRVKRELANTKGSLQQATADARTAMSQAAAARKELDEQKATFEQMRVDRDAAKAFLETEKAHSVRLQDELRLAREQMAYLRARSSAAAQFAPAMPVQSRPLRVEMAPQRSQAIGVSVPAGAPPSGQGYGRPPAQ